MIFNVLSPIAFTIDAESFKDAAKKFVVMQKNLDITRLILADRFNSRMQANVVYTLDNGNYKAKIGLFPTTLTSLPAVGVVSNNPNTAYPVIGTPLIGVKPAGFTRTNYDGDRQVFPITNNNIAAVGVNAGLIGVGGVAIPSSPMYSPYPGYFLNNKNMRQ
jgi:hypothetical protein